MKRLITFVLGILCVSISAFSQTDQERAEMAKDYLDKMSKKNKSYSTINAAFTLTIDNKQDNSKNDIKGNLKIKGDKFQLDVANSITYFDGKDQCTWMQETNEATISESDLDSEAPITPMQFLGAYDKGYKMRYIESHKIDNIECVEIDLYPTDRKGNIARVRLAIDKNNYVVKRIMQQGKDGTSYYVTINKFTTNTEIPDSEFKFDATKHPGVEIIDLR